MTSSLPPSVTVRVRPQAPTAALELRGELPCWSVGHPMIPAGDGFELTLPLGPGVYAVKAQAPGGAWWIDPAWRTMHDGEVENGALVIGGTDEPVLHAPAAPWLERLDDGSLRVRAGLRRSAAGSARGSLGSATRSGAALPGLSLRCDDGAGVVTRRMRAVDTDASHVYFELRVSGAGKRLRYSFVLDDGRTVAGPAGAWLDVTINDLPAPAPAWWRDAVVYTVFVDRFRRGGTRGAWPDGAAARWDREHRAGGDLRGVVEALPALVDLGVTALHLTPLCPAPSPHRYDAVDPRAVDPALGGDAAFTRLCDAAHAAGIRILCDVAGTHVDRGFAPFQDVLARGPASPYWSWFDVQRWPCSDGPDPGYAHYHKGCWREPLLRTGEPAVADWLVDTFVSWIRRGADGVRVDAAADLPLPLIARIRAAVRAARPDAVVFGEVVPACVDRFAPGALDAATDFTAREALVSWLRGDTPAAAVVRTASRQRRRGAAGPRGLGFTGTHDQPRIATLVGADRARLALLAVTLGARVPMLYYGDELGLASTEIDASARSFEDSWPDRQCLPWDESAWDLTTRALVRDALALRRRCPALTRGDEELLADGDVLILRRTLGDQVVDLLLHAGDVAVELPSAPSLGPSTSSPASPWTAGETPPTVLLATGGATVLPDGRVHLPPRSALVLDRTPPAPAHAAELVTRNAELVEQAFVARMTDLPTYPTHLNVTVTEACNLRCAHCITDAPARTREGRARTLTPWLLDALADAFAHADHIAFTHGGEALASPAFLDTLRAIRRARAGRRIELHLATNGMLLDAERLRTIVDLGVTSIMVSLDGATPATNNRIRVLGDLHRVLDNVTAALAHRARSGADFRLGISTVVGRSNVAELPALARTCASLGVDWLKLEETYPLNAFSRADFLAPTDPAVLDAVASVRAILAGTSVVLVDHLAPAPADPAFRAADDYANRTTFHRERPAYHHAAVDPDGTVHLLDPAGPVLGNLLDAPFLTLWNAPAASDSRTRSGTGS